MEQDELEELLLTYTQECLRVCGEQSQEGVMLAASVLDTLLRETDRMTKLQPATHDALRKFKDLLTANRENRSGEGSASLSSLVMSLSTFSAEFEFIDAQVRPLIESIHVRDRTYQHIENLDRAYKYWYEMRKNLTEESDPKAELVKLGQRLHESATTDEERDLIKQFIPGVI